MAKASGELAVRVVHVLVLGDIALIAHIEQDQVAAIDGGLGLLLGPLARQAGRRVDVRRGDDAREHRCLVWKKLGSAGGLPLLAAALVGGAEVRLGGGLDAISAFAEVDRVEVLRDDLVLGPVALELVGKRRFAELLKDGAVVLGCERVLHELLGDGRGALLGRAGQDVLVDGAGDALVVDAAVLVEAAILDRHDRLLHHRGDLVRLDEDAALVVRERGQANAVAIFDD